MLRRVWLLGLGLLLAPTVAWAACGSVVDGVQKCTITFESVTREYWLHIPSSGSTPRPLVVILHGGETAVDTSVAPQLRVALAGATEPLEATADSLNVVVAYPRSGQQCLPSPCSSGTTYQWNLGPEACTVLGTCKDDVGFINAAIADMKTQTSINASQVAVAGHSGGAFMVLRMFCQSGGNSHATVGHAVSGSLTAQEVALCTNTSTTRLFLYNGTRDDAIPYIGTVGFGSQPIGIETLPVGRAAFQVIALGARAGSPTAWSTTNYAVASTAVDGNCVTIAQHTGANVWVYTIGSGVAAPIRGGWPGTNDPCYSTGGTTGQNGGGHTWPGTSLATSPYGFGKYTHFINTNDQILATVTGG